MPVAVLALTIPSLHHVQRHHLRHHRPGCRTLRCDRWADARWAQLHRAQASGSSGQQAVASWYSDSEGLACARAPDGMGVASLTVPCGARVRLCHAGCVTATVDDHGPYIAGRTFDLNAAVKNAIGCSDLCNVVWSRA